MSHMQLKLIKIAQLHHMHAEARPEGDVAVFIPMAHIPFDEIEVVTNMCELRDVLGY